MTIIPHTQKETTTMLSTLTQLNHNAWNFLRHKWNLNNSQILLQNLLSKVLICFERYFHQKVALKFEDEDWSCFPFSQMTFKISFLYVNVWIHWLAILMRSSKTLGQAYFCCKFQLFTISGPYPNARRLLERQCYNNHLKLKS